MTGESLNCARRNTATMADRQRSTSDASHRSLASVDSSDEPLRGRRPAAASAHKTNGAAGRVPAVATRTRGGLRVYKVVILGDGGVGKSAVTLQFVSHSFLDYHDPTIEDSYQQQAVIDGEPALLDILDTAGQVEFTAMRDQYMRCGEGFIICYSVTDRHSFQEASEYRKLIARVRLTEDIPLVLIANKLDLTAQRKVTTEEGRTLASQLGCPFYETSAALRHFIDDAFHALIREIRRKEEYRALSNGSSSEKVGRRRRSRWWRIRSIFAMVFRRKRTSSNN